jgi:hypothetical protein
VHRCLAPFDELTLCVTSQEHQKRARKEKYLEAKRRQEELKKLFDEQEQRKEKEVAEEEAVTQQEKGACRSLLKLTIHSTTAVSSPAASASKQGSFFC